MTVRIFCTRSRCDWWVRMHLPYAITPHELLESKYSDKCPKCGCAIDAVEESQPASLSDPRD